MHQLIHKQKRSQDPYARGKNTGRKARQQNRPEPLTEGRCDRWIEGMKEGYHGGASGRPLHGDRPKVVISVRVDDNLRLKAIAMGINRSKACELGLAIATNDPSQWYKILADYQVAPIARK